MFSTQYWQLGGHGLGVAARSRVSYRLRVRSGAAIDVTSSRITGFPALLSYRGQVGRPFPFGFPDRAKLAQYRIISSDNS